MENSKEILKGRAAHAQQPGAAKISVLFICLGNICRSVAAEGVFKHLAEQAGAAELFDVDSAGLIDYHEGELADSRMRERAARRGISLTHRSRPVRTADFARFQVIVAMDEQNVRGLRAVAPNDAAMGKVVRMAAYLRQHKSATVPDPYYGTLADFDHVLDLLFDACQTLLDVLVAEHDAEA